MQWLPREVIEEKCAQEEEQEFAGSVTERLDQAGFDTEFGLRNCGGDMDLYTELLSDYVDARTEKVEELDRYFEEGNLHDFEIRIHALKSVSKTIGAAAIAEEAFALEKAAEREDADSL